jgi:hypothetical protein
MDYSYPLRAPSASILTSLRVGAPSSRNHRAGKEIMRQSARIRTDRRSVEMAATDHLAPISIDGLHIRFNVTLARRRCNSLRLGQ